MDNGTTIAVAAGLAVGIGFVMVFAYLLDQPFPIIIKAPPSPEVMEPTYNVTLSIEGLNDIFHSGEPITFILRVYGHGNYCQSPNSGIQRADEGSDTLPIWRSGLPLVLCQVDNMKMNSTFHDINDEYEYPSSRNITITEPGKYVLAARIAGDPAVQKEFSVTP